MRKFYFGFLAFTMIISIDAMAFNYFHCKAATCHEFYYASFCFFFFRNKSTICFEIIIGLEKFPSAKGIC
jgi:hypothetical protein